MTDRHCRPRAAVLLLAVAIPASLPAQSITDAVSPPSSLSGEARRRDSLGLEEWRKYEGTAHRVYLKKTNDTDALPTPRMSDGQSVPMDRRGLQLVDGGLEAVPRHRVAQALRDLAVPMKPAPGNGYYTAAVEHFRAALALDSTNADARRHLFRTQVEKDDWTALLAEAGRALRLNETDADAWLARGLALHRQDDYPGAATAFERALPLLLPDRARRFLATTPMLAPKAYTRTLAFPDAQQFAKLSLAEQQRWSNLFWESADPRPSTRLNEARLEYFARIAYADLRWTNDLSQLGTDTDRGDVHVRFGPPQAIYGFQGVNIWTYRDNQVFYFGSVAGYRNTRIANAERDVVDDSILVESSFGWTNMPLVRRTWPMRARVARFRASADSADVVVTAAVPVRSFLADVELQGRFPVDVYLDVRDTAMRTVGAERRQVVVSHDSLPVGINSAWVRRLGTGVNVVRVEAGQSDVGRAAVSIERATIDSLTGFGMSDILLGTNPRPAGAGAPARWRDVSIAPTVGVTPYKQALGMVWETYDLVPKDGNVAYTITLQLERTFEKTMAGFSARILRGMMNVIAQDGSATGRISVSYPQSRPAAAVITDFLAIDLNGSVPGPYRLHITITDTNSGRVTRRSADFHLTPD